MKPKNIRSSPSYQVSADQKQDTNTSSESEQKPIFQRKHKFSLWKCVIIKRKMFYVDWAVCNVWIDICVCLQIFKKAKQVKKDEKKKSWSPQAPGL